MRIGDFGRDAQFPLTHGRMCLLGYKHCIYKQRVTSVWPCSSPRSDLVFVGSLYLSRRGFRSASATLCADSRAVAVRSDIHISIPAHVLCTVRRLNVRSWLSANARSFLTRLRLPRMLLSKNKYRISTTVTKSTKKRARSVLFSSALIDGVFITTKYHAVVSNR
jgi:hypothetical protein